jgi:hypothetical protein
VACGSGRFPTPTCAIDREAEGVEAAIDGVRVALALAGDPARLYG